MADSSVRRSASGHEYTPHDFDVFMAHDIDVPDLGAGDNAPPAYGDYHNELQLSQAGFEAEAAVTCEPESFPSVVCDKGLLTSTPALEPMVVLTSTSTKRTGGWPNSSRQPSTTSSAPSHSSHPDPCPRHTSPRA
jgi:hypothetical protein